MLLPDRVTIPQLVSACCLSVRVYCVTSCRANQVFRSQWVPLLALVVVCTCIFLVQGPSKGRITHSMPFPCRAAKGLECVFPIWFTQRGRVWFTLAMPWPCRSSQGHSTEQHSPLSTAVLCCGFEKNGLVGAWHGHGHGMASVNQTRPQCVNKMGHILNP